MRKTSNVENDKNDFDKNDFDKNDFDKNDFDKNVHNTKSGSFLSSRSW